MNTTKHPIDFDAFGRGDLITESVILTAARAERVDVTDPDKVRLFALRLKGRVQQNLFDRGEGIVSVKVEKGGLRILRDGSEQAGYCESESKKLLRQFRRRHEEACSVNPALLSSEERKRWHNMVVKSSLMLGAAGYPRRRLPALPKIVEPTE